MVNSADPIRLSERGRERLFREYKHNGRGEKKRGVGPTSSAPIFHDSAAHSLTKNNDLATTRGHKVRRDGWRLHDIDGNETEISFVMGKIGVWGEET